MAVIGMPVGYGPSIAYEVEAGTHGVPGAPGAPARSAAAFGRDAMLGSALCGLRCACLFR